MFLIIIYATNMYLLTNYFIYTWSWHGLDLKGMSYNYNNTGADPGFLDRRFKLAEGGLICAVWPIFPEIPMKMK